MNEHTPTPWALERERYFKTESGSFHIAYTDSGSALSWKASLNELKANAAFIVQAVNSYQAMREALTALANICGQRGLDPVVVKQCVADAWKALALTQNVEVTK
jgi:hypothetical protein